MLSVLKETGPYPPDHVGQGYDVFDRQLASGLKDARLTSMELALSALEALRRDGLGVRPRDAGTTAAVDAGNSSPDSGVSDGVTVPGQTIAARASLLPPGASPPTGAGAAATAEARNCRGCRGGQRGHAQGPDRARAGCG